MQSTIQLLASHPEMRGRTLDAQGMVNSSRHLFGDSAIGALASAFGIGLVISLNAEVALVLLVPMLILTPLVWRPITGPR